MATSADERIMRDIAARLNAVGVKADVIEVPDSALSLDLNIHDVLAELSQLRKENWRLLEQIDAFLAHPVLAARELRAERAASAPSEHGREDGAAIDATRPMSDARRGSGPSGEHYCPNCDGSCFCAEWYDGDECQHQASSGCQQRIGER